jgi:hypothetical protein
VLLHGEFVMEGEQAQEPVGSGASEGLVVVRDHQEPARQASACRRDAETLSFSQERPLALNQVAIQVLELDPEVSEARGTRTPCPRCKRSALLGSPILLDEGQELLLRIGPWFQFTLDETLDPEAVVLEQPHGDSVTTEATQEAGGKLSARRLPKSREVRGLRSPLNCKAPPGPARFAFAETLHGEGQCERIGG